MVIRFRSGTRPGKDTLPLVDSVQPTRNHNYALGNTTSD
jgi:hypothetical protein